MRRIVSDKYKCVCEYVHIRDMFGEQQIAQERKNEKELTLKFFFCMDLHGYKMEIKLRSFHTDETEK